MLKVGIAGGSGYVAGELIRLLVEHPKVEIDFIYSHSSAGKKASDFHDDLFAHPELVLSQEVNPKVDVLFLCLGHGKSRAFIEKHPFSEHTLIIDLGNDFRLTKDAQFQSRLFDYGLVAAGLFSHGKSKSIANPGCFATAIQLALLPLAKAQLLDNEIHVQAITGATGAGRSLSETSHFSWRNNNVSVYKAFGHQHEDEILQTLGSLQTKPLPELSFVPMRGSFTRGIMANVYTKVDLDEEELVRMYDEFYAKQHFVYVSSEAIHLKQVVNTNMALIKVEKHGNKAFINVALDNLLMGAAGQAVHNMNLAYGLEEDLGLKLKANYF